MKKLTVVILLLLHCALLFSGCNYETVPHEISTVSDLAYETTLNKDCLVYIEESDGYAPYLVLTDDYGGNTLLLRKYVLDELIAFNENKRYGSHYENSYVDIFLTEEFYEKLPKITKDIIVDTNVEITSITSYGSGDRETTLINRKVFLLAFSEVAHRKSRTDIAEGKPLAYFAEVELRIAYHENGDVAGWWLRTPNVGSTTAINGVNTKGIVAFVALETIAGMTEGGIRPAFCVDNTIPVIQSENIVDEQTVYILDLEQYDVQK
ncbi:MAG: DUF6273 domain-containing protein [Clostridiales bacterium]|nr:DUF6273 domain-containing protein [Clostridiales bacterium]